MAECAMCSAPNKKLYKRWFAYDNGQQFQTYVCMKCAKVHSDMLKEEANA